MPGHFAADGKAEIPQPKPERLGALHYSPDKAGKWTYRVSFVQGKNAALTSAEGKALKSFMASPAASRSARRIRRGVTFGQRGVCNMSAIAICSLPVREGVFPEGRG